MPEITLIVNDRPYKMACDPGEEKQLRELAEFVDREIGQLKEEFGEAGENRLQVMASLVIADKLADAVRKIEALQTEIESLKDARTVALERARSLEDSVAEKLEAAAGRVELLSARLSAAAK